MDCMGLLERERLEPPEPDDPDEYINRWFDLEDVLFNEMREGLQC